MRARHVPGPLLAIAGAVVVWVGAFSVWASTTVDPAALARATEVDPDGAHEVADFIEASYSWVEGAWSASWMLTLAVFVVILAAIALWWSHRALAITIGGIGAIVAVTAAITRVDPAVLAASIARDAEELEGAAAWDAASIEAAIRVSAGPSTARCLVGAGLVVVGGVVALLLPRPEPPPDPSYVPWDRLHETES